MTKRLPIDQEYTIKETITNEKYVLNDEIVKVTLEQDKIKSMTFENEQRKGQIEIIKVDSENNEIKLEGVTFEIIDSNGNVVDAIVTDSNGKATSKRLSIYDEYTVKEKETRKEYVLSEETQKVVLEENEIKSITFENKMKRGSIRIIKVSNGENKVLNIADGTLLSGAKFIVSNSNGDVFGVYETDENGTIQIDNLPYGEYNITEYEAPEGYIKDAESKNVSIIEDGQIVEVKFTNSPIQPELPKTGYDIELPISIITAFMVAFLLTKNKIF